MTGIEILRLYGAIRGIIPADLDLDPDKEYEVFTSDNIVTIIQENKLVVYSQPFLERID
jgi:hypothetical protein